MIRIKSFIYNPFQVNTFVVYDETLNCLIIDAACFQKDEFDNLFDFIAKNSLIPGAVLNTHGHMDHLTGTARICEKYGIGLIMHPDDLLLLENGVEYGRTFGFQIEAPPKPQSWLNDGDIYHFGNSEIIAWHTPGHSPGSLVFYAPNEKFLITGDVLFAGSIGRTDLPGGNYQQLINSIRAKILVLPRDTIVFPGHGPETTIGTEIDYNPFLNRSS
jgi:hydroxyacylglutathione hydrolase